MSSRKREEDFEVQSRADSDTLTELFHDQIRGSHDAFLLESRDLTVEHVNRLSSTHSLFKQGFCQRLYTQL